MQISRLFEIVYILMNKKTTTAKELSEHFEVSQRTVYRDIETLCQAGIPIYTSKGKGGGIGLLEQFVLNKSVLSEQEQNEILSALSGFKAASNSNSNQVLTKLSSLFGTKNFDWIEVDFSNWNSGEEDKAKFNIIKEAILNRAIITFDYYNSYGQQSHRITEPRKLIFKGQAWYLFGYCRDKNDFRYFKISRIKGLTKESDHFIETPLPSPLKDANPSPTNINPLSIILRIDAVMAYRIYDEFPPEAIEREENGSFLIRTKLQPGGWLLGYLISYEDHLEVLEPFSLRDDIRNIYENALKKYRI